MGNEGQFSTFLLCVAVGFCAGGLYEVFAFFRLLLGCDREKNKILGGILDAGFFILFGVSTVFFAFWWNFPDFRFYRWLGYGIGFAIYLKTLRRMVAFLEKVCYNKCVKHLKRAKRKSNRKVRREYDTR